LASDLENQERAAVAAPTEENSETKPETKVPASKGDGKGADAKSGDASTGADRPSDDKAAAEKLDAKPDTAGKTGDPAAVQQPGQRRRHGGAAGQGQKNGTLDLVEL
jgi:hypothetical protein